MIRGGEMENFLSPSDPLFKTFYFLGFVVLSLVIGAGILIVYDSLREGGDGQDR